MRHRRLRRGRQAWVAVAGIGIAVVAVASVWLSAGAAAKPPSAEANAKDLVQLLVDGKKTEALRYLEPAEAHRVGEWAPSFILTGRPSFAGDCRVGEARKENYATTPAVMVPMDCGTEKFRIYAMTTNNPDVFNSISEQMAQPGT